MVVLILPFRRALIYLEEEVAAPSLAQVMLCSKASLCVSWRRWNWRRRLREIYEINFVLEGFRVRWEIELVRNAKRRPSGDASR